MLTALGIIACALPFFLAPFDILLLWAALFPLFDHLETAKFGDLIPAITFGRVFLVVIIAKYYVNRDRGLLIDVSTFRALEKVMILFVVVFFLEIYAAFRPKDATRNFISFFESFAMPFLLYFVGKYYVRNQVAANRLFRALLMGGVVAALMGIYEQITRVDLLPYIPQSYVPSDLVGLRVRAGCRRPGSESKRSIHGT